MVGRRSAAAAVAAALAAGGCAGDPAARPQPAPELDAEVTQYRRDQPLQRVQVKLANLGPSDVVVERLRLEAAGFTSGPDVAKDATLRPGTRVDLPAPYGEAQCGAGPSASPAPAGGRVVLTVRAADGTRHEVAVPLPREPGVLGLVHQRECREQRLQAAAELGFAPAWPEEVRDGRPTLLPTLVVRRRGGTERVTVTEAGGHVLFTVRPDPPRPAPLLVLEPGDERAELPLAVTTTRCDGHALAESKRTPLFLLYVAVGDDEPRVALVEADRSVHAQLSDFATRSCRG